MYYINRYRKNDVSLNDLVTLIGVLGGGVVLAIFPANTDLFGAYGIGLFAGFFSYFLSLLIFVGVSRNFTVEWFLDGRRKRPTSPFFIPGDKAGGTAMAMDSSSLGEGGSPPGTWQERPKMEEPEEAGPVPEGEREMAEAPSQIPVKNYVNSGFADPLQPDAFLNKNHPLLPDQEYYFCLGVGDLMPESIIETPTVLPGLEELPAQAVLQVVLYAFPGEFLIDQEASVGLLRLTSGGYYIVERQPGSPGRVPEAPWLLFPVKTPIETGRMRLRCSIYYEQFLVQSYLISVEIWQAGSWQGEGPAQISEIDYNLSQSMSANHLSGIKPHRLSLMVNDNGDGTHGFRFFGKGEFKSDATLDGQELQSLINYARFIFRRTAWGDEKAYDKQTYRYAGAPDKKRLWDDLISLSIRGFRIYDQVINRLAGGAAQASKLCELMDDRGLVQVALKHSARFVLPAALIYDYPFDTDAEPEAYQLCHQFLDALDGPAPLEQCACFDGNCPSRGDELTLCPSGFWGFRHEIGLPLSLKDMPDAPTEIAVQGNPSYLISVCLDPEFILREEHETHLRSLVTNAQWTRVDSRETTFQAMKSAAPHLIYFYCHGGLTSSNTPYIQVGSLEERGITRDNLRFKGIAWDKPRPLVFINGCHTTALEPESAIELVSGFIETSGAAGVIGTEISVFEPLATTFAEVFLKAFFQGVEIGEAIRRARLALLKQCNPLGLVYIPYAMAGLHLQM